MPKIVDKEIKKNMILEAAISEFAQRGVNNTKMVDIAKAANIGKGTIYEYFPSKEAVFLESMSFFMNSMNQTIMESLEGIDDPGEKIRGLIDACVKNANEFQDLLTIVLDFWSFGVRGEQITEWQAGYKMFQSVIGNIIEEGINRKVFKPVDVNYFSSAIIGLLDGIVFQTILFKKDYDLAAAGNAAADMILNGMTQ